MGIPFSSGVQWLFDQHQKFVRSGLKVYLRVKNFTEQGENLEVGIPVSDPQSGGYTDHLIQPPPTVQDVSMHNLGMAAQAGVRLNFGSKIFTISNTFVREQVDLIEKASGTQIDDPIQVFRNRDGKGVAVGIVYQGRMHDIVYPMSRQVSGQTVSWRIVGNAHEQLLADEPASIST